MIEVITGLYLPRLLIYARSFLQTKAFITLQSRAVWQGGKDSVQVLPFKETFTFDCNFLPNFGITLAVQPLVLLC